MKEDQLTPWFPAEVKPVHVGVYQRDYANSNGCPVWCRFDGIFWHAYSNDRDEAEKVRAISDVEAPWRGLSSKPYDWGEA